MSNRLKAFALLPIIAAAGPVAAQESISVDQLDQRVKILERQLEIQKEEADAKAASTATVTAGSNGFAIKSANGDYELAFHGLIQGDGRFYVDDKSGSTPGTIPSNFLLRRVEPTLQGNLGKYVGFLITPEFGGNSVGLLDFWGELRFSPAANVRVGRFKEPVGLENLQSSASLVFIERGLPTDLVPGRDIGVQLGGKLLSNTVSYALGIFNGAADGGDATPPDSDNRQDFAARVFAEPFKNQVGVLQNLGVGVAGTYGGSRGFAGATPVTTAANTFSIVSSYKSPGQQSAFSYRATTNSDGERAHLSPQLYWYYNSVGLLSEYVISQQKLVNTTNVHTIDNRAYQVAVNYVLSGEDASYTGVKPKNSFKVGGDGWGAFEVAARYGNLKIDKDAFAGGAASFADPTKAISEAREIGVALNWYLTSNAKVAVNYEHTSFNGGAVGKDRQDEQAILSRLQVSF